MRPREDGVRQNETRSIITSTIRGVMTEEVGAVTGHLEVATRLQQSVVAVTIRYAGAEEWYTVEGGPITLNSSGSLSPSELRRLHERIVTHLTKPGMIVEGNEEPASLWRFSPLTDG